MSHCNRYQRPWNKLLSDARTRRKMSIEEAVVGTRLGRDDWSSFEQGDRFPSESEHAVILTRLPDMKKHAGQLTAERDGAPPAVEAPAAVEPNPEPTVEIVAPVPPSAIVQMVDVMGIMLRCDGEEPRISDEALAERLLVDVRVIRKHVAELLASKELNESEVLHERCETYGAGGRPATRCWLTESAALLVVMRSRSTVAAQLRRTIAEVFRLARRGKMSTSDVAALVPVVNAMGEALASLARSQEQARADNAAILSLISTLETRLSEVQRSTEDTQKQIASGSAGTLTEQVWRSEIRPLLRDVAELETGSYVVKVVERGIRSVEKRLRNLLGFNGKGAKWALFPTARRHDMERALLVFKTEAQRIQRERANADKARAAEAQGTLPFPIKKPTAAE